MCSSTPSPPINPSRCPSLRSMYLDERMKASLSSAAKGEGCSCAGSGFGKWRARTSQLQLLLRSLGDGKFCRPDADLAQCMKPDYATTPAQFQRISAMGISTEDFIRVGGRLYRPKLQMIKGCIRVGRAEEGTSSLRPELAALRFSSPERLRGATHCSW